MQKDIHDDDQDTVTITTEQTFRPGKLEIAVCDGQTSSWYGNRAQVRALIEALRQADAKTRTGPEFIARHSFGSTNIVVLRVGSAREEDYWYLTPSGFSDPASKAKVEEFIRAKTAGTILEGATIYFHGFPDEPTE